MDNSFSFALFRRIWKILTARNKSRLRAPYGLGLLSQVAAAGQLESLVFILDHGVGPLQEEHPHGLPLLTACKYDRLPCVRVLFARGCNNERPAFEIISEAFRVGKYFTEIRHFDRYTWQAKICAVEENTDAVLREWTGPRKLEIPIVGRYVQGQRSLLDYVRWLAKEDKQRLVTYSESFSNLV
jgi:hypothetical protein